MLPVVAQRYVTTHAEGTKQLGRCLGRQARAGDCIACIGPLGAGKTTFVQGFAAGLGVTEETYVRSPTFALVHEYHGRLPLFHFDFYRLSCAAELYDIGFEEYLEAGGVVIAEWGDRFLSALPSSRLDISFSLTAMETRRILCTAHTDSHYHHFLCKCIQ
ncbi:MAG: tRNA (adenosine(37)-N6)-threonylcarbamoyltransferase complex ATPase subunit type 1 TsaE [Candidatus Tectimicrobiota bacterium]